MKRELKDKWVKALRSGKYKQTKLRLKARNNSFCCLGVLCEVMGKKSVYDSTYQEYTYDKRSDSLSSNLCREAGIKDRTQYKLMNMNDNMGKKFPEIADWIEKNIRTRN